MELCFWVWSLASGVPGSSAIVPYPIRKVETPGQAIPQKKPPPSADQSLPIPHIQRGRARYATSGTCPLAESFVDRHGSRYHL